jgi:hypothetical protein
VNNFSKALEVLIISDKLREKFGQKGITSIGAFSADKIIEKWEDLIHLR